MRNLRIILHHKPGELARLTELLGTRGINIEAGCGIACDKDGHINIITSDADTTKKLLEEAGFEIQDDREMLTVMGGNHPGQLGLITKRLEKANINIELFYMGTQNRLIFGVDNLDKAKEVISQIYEKAAAAH